MKKDINNLIKSFELSGQKINDVVNPLDLAAIFEKERIAYVLIGGHMLSFYTGNIRATVDVDFIIGGSDFSRAAKVVDKAYSRYIHNDHVYHVTYDSQQSDLHDPERIDLVKDGFPLFREVVNHYCYKVGAEKQQIRVPTLEAAIALKFAASISPNRSDLDKPVDHSDLLSLVRSGDCLDYSTLGKLGDYIYVGGGRELISIVKDILEGKNVSL